MPFFCFWLLAFGLLVIGILIYYDFKFGSIPYIPEFRGIGYVKVLYASLMI